MKKIKIFFFLLFCMACFSCATKTENLSYVDVNGNPEIVNEMVVRIVDLIQEEKGVEDTTINLMRKGTTVFDKAILDELQNRGFAMSETEGVITSFVIDSFEENKIYLTVTLDKIIFSQIFVYEAQTGMIKPGSPLNKGEV